MTTMLYQYRIWLSPLLTFVATLILLTAIYMPLAAKQEKYHDIIKINQPHIERLLGLIQAAPQIESQLATARSSVQQFFYPAGSDDNRLNTELQTRLRDLAQQSGVTVGSVRGLPTRKERGLSVHLLSLSLKGGLPELNKFMNALQLPTDTNPALHIDSLSLRRANFTPNTPQTLNIDITIAALQPARPQAITP